MALGLKDWHYSYTYDGIPWLEEWHIDVLAMSCIGRLPHMVWATLSAAEGVFLCTYVLTFIVWNGLHS